jgi:DNA-binding transcriptional MocR family regulator
VSHPAQSEQLNRVLRVATVSAVGASAFGIGVLAGDSHFVAAVSLELARLLR